MSAEASEVRTQVLLINILVSFLYEGLVLLYGRSIH